MKPHTPITSPDFAWTPSYDTDIRRRFQAIRQQNLNTHNQQVADTASVLRIFDDRRRKQIEADETALRG